MTYEKGISRTKSVPDDDSYSTRLFTRLSIFSLAAFFHLSTRYDSQLPSRGGPGDVL